MGCGVSWHTEEPSTARLEIAEWLFNNGADVHEGGDAPLMRASLNGTRTPMMELLVRHGADVNAAWHGVYPVLFAPCETLDPMALDWLLQHGADPDCGEASDWQSKGRSHPGTALDFVLGTYVRDKDELNESIKLIRDAGGSSQYDEPGVIATIRGDSAEIELLLRKDHFRCRETIPIIEHRHHRRSNAHTQRRNAVACRCRVWTAGNCKEIARSGCRYRCTCSYRPAGHGRSDSNLSRRDTG